MMSITTETVTGGKTATNRKITPFYKFKGPGYFDVLSSMHEALGPSTYLEIGTATGQSLSLSSCASIAVDPKFEIDQDVIGKKPEAHFFQQTSDSFFSSRFAEALRHERSIDLAFLDGMHLFEFLLRDFIGTEQLCADDAVIALHDCLPGDVFMTSRQRNDEYHRMSAKPNWWTGDVWKILPILKRYRPALNIVTLGAPPTGLVLISNLEAGNGLLAERYQEILKEYREVDLENYGFERFLEETGPQSPEEFCKTEFLRSRFRPAT